MEFLGWELGATEVVAAYAALVATGGLLWQVRRDRRERRPDVTVTGGHNPGRLGEGKSPYGDDDMGGTFTMLLQPTSAVTVTKAGLARPGRRSRRWELTASAAWRGLDSSIGGVPLPRAIEAANWMRITIRETKAAECGVPLEPGTVLVGWAELSNGHRYQTEPFEVAPRRPTMEDEMRENKRRAEARKRGQT